LTATVAPPVAVAEELAGALLLELLVLPPQPAATTASATAAPAMASNRLIEPPFKTGGGPSGGKPASASADSPADGADRTSTERGGSDELGTGPARPPHGMDSACCSDAERWIVVIKGGRA
jgi:hypothetical protein